MSVTAWNSKYPEPLPASCALLACLYMGKAKAAARAPRPRQYAVRSVVAVSLTPRVVGEAAQQ
jgi:hypothetical protein